MRNHSHEGAECAITANEVLVVKWKTKEAHPMQHHTKAESINPIKNMWDFETTTIPRNGMNY